MGGSKGGGDSVTRTEPSALQKPYIERIYSEAEKAYDQTSKQPFTGAYTAAPNELQRQALQQAGQYAQSNMNVGAPVMDYARRMLAGDFLTAESNPALQGAMNAVRQNAQEDLFRNVLPQLTSNAESAGAYDNTRTARLQGQVLDDYNENVQNTLAKMGYQNYSDERKLQNTAAQQLAAGQQLDTSMLNLLANVGQTQQGFEQAQLDEARNQWQARQQAPWQGLDQFSNMLGTGGNFSVTTQSGGGGGGGMLSGALGGGMLGKSLFPVLGKSLADNSAVTALGGLGPTGMIGGAVLGGLAGGLF